MEKSVNNMWLSKNMCWIMAVILAITVGRFVWLVQSDNVVFESDIAALLPIGKDLPLVKNIHDRIAGESNHRIAMIIQGSDIAQVDAATDRLTDLLDQGMAQNKIAAGQADQLEFDRLPARIKAMLAYKDRLIGDRSRRRMQESIESQLNWRMQQVTRFPPSNITDPVADPLGTMDEFLRERLPNLPGVQFDGLYLRVEHDTLANLILLKLTEGEPGNDDASHSVRWILSARDTVVKEFGVNLYLSGMPIHATSIKQQTISEVRWMAFLAATLTLGFFLYITRSVRALLLSASIILLAIAGGLVISFETIGLPHVIGLTMATAAIGICIDYSFHFWIHVRAGMSGATAIRTILPGLQMSFLTTIAGLLVITFTSIPILARSAVFVSGVLLVSWLITLFIVPHMAAANVGEPKLLRMQRSTLPVKFAVVLVLAITFASATGLIFKYYTDDNPIRLGPQIDSLIQDDLAVRDLLGITDQPSIYLVEENSADALIEAETSLLKSLSSNELALVEAMSRLVVSKDQQRHNQSLFKRAMNDLDAGLLMRYLETLRVPDLDWKSSADKQYALQWVMTQPWATIERNNVLACDLSACASMIRARGDAAVKLDASCQRTPECTRISLSERQLSIFQKLRSSLTWALLLAAGAVFVVLYFRYRNKAFMLMAVPLLASFSGIAAVAWAGMPITVFTLAAIFPLLGLSIDYVVFASESRNNSTPTFLAIFASALTTSFSFWVLFLSTTPAVQYFALPIAVGIPVAWISVQIVRTNHA